MVNASNNPVFLEYNDLTNHFHVSCVSKVYPIVKGWVLIGVLPMSKAAPFMSKFKRDNLTLKIVQEEYDKLMCS